MSLQKGQAVIDELTSEIMDLRQENERLRTENRRLGGGRVIIRERESPPCRASLPDSPSPLPWLSGA